MVNDNPSKNAGPIGEIPSGLVFLHRLIFLVEAGLAIFLVFRGRLEIGILFTAYGIVCVFLLIPIVHYGHRDLYGGRCTLGWGGWAARFFPKDSVISGDDYRGLTILYWPLRIIPILFGLYFLLQGFMAKFYFIPQGIFGIYIAILIIQNFLFKAYACPVIASIDGPRISNIDRKQ